MIMAGPFSSAGIVLKQSVEIWLCETSCLLCNNGGISYIRYGTWAVLVGSVICLFSSFYNNENLEHHQLYPERVVPF